MATNPIPRTKLQTIRRILALCGFFTVDYLEKQSAEELDILLVMLGPPRNFTMERTK